jgi:hypothetical protein
VLLSRNSIAPVDFDGLRIFDYTAGQAFGSGDFCFVNKGRRFSYANERSGRPDERSAMNARPSNCATYFGGVTPIFSVGDLRISVDHYVGVLGFKVDFLDSIASVSRDRCALFLVEGDQVQHPRWKRA